MYNHLQQKNSRRRSAKVLQGSRNARRQRAMNSFIACGAFATSALAGVASAVPVIATSEQVDEIIAVSETVEKDSTVRASGRSAASTAASAAAATAAADAAASAAADAASTAAAADATADVAADAAATGATDAAAADAAAVPLVSAKKPIDNSGAGDTTESADADCAADSENKSNKDLAGGFLIPEQLERQIQMYGKEEFMRRYGQQIFGDANIIALINRIKQNQRGIKSILSSLVTKDESTIATDVEISDQDFDERRYRQENSVQPGKTGVLVVLFKRVLDWIFGKEFLEEVLEAGKKERMIRDRLKDLGIKTRDLTPEQMQDLMDMTASKKAPYKGIVFDPSSKQWPNMQTLDAAPAIAQQKMKDIAEAAPSGQ